MSLSFTVSGNPLPLPRQQEPFGMEYIPLGTKQRAMSGLLRVQIITARWRVQIHWEGLNKSERDSLFAFYCTYLASSGLWSFPDGTSFSGLTSTGSWEESHWIQPHSGTVYYDVNFTVEQE